LGDFHGNGKVADAGIPQSAGFLALAAFRSVFSA
jgi:hypothetical protein